MPLGLSPKLPHTLRQAHRPSACHVWQVPGAPVKQGAHGDRALLGQKPCPATLETGAATAAIVWSEQEAWDVQIQVACGTDDDAIAALRRNLTSLRTLLPDLDPHWQKLMETNQSLAAIEALLREDTDEAPQPGAEGARQQQARGDVCKYADAQEAARRLRALSPVLLSCGAPGIGNYLQHSEYVLAEALMGAAANYCGPGSALLRGSDLEMAAAAVRVLRRSHEAFLQAHMRAQVQLAAALPEASRRLVEIRQYEGNAAVDVGQTVAAYPMMLVRAMQQEPHSPP